MRERVWKVEMMIGYFYINKIHIWGFVFDKKHGDLYSYIQYI